MRHIPLIAMVEAHRQEVDQIPDLNSKRKAEHWTWRFGVAVVSGWRNGSENEGHLKHLPRSLGLEEHRDMQAAANPRCYLGSSISTWRRSCWYAVRIAG